jgi:multidrug efflux pump
MFANVAPGHSQDEVLKYVERLARDADGLPRGARRRQRRLPRVDGRAAVRARPRDRRRLHGPRLAVQLVPPPGHDPLTILPLSVAGAAFALLLAGKSLNIFSMIGLLLLMGIVKKNSIILVDYANQLRAKGSRALRRCSRRARCGSGRS